MNTEHTPGPWYIEPILRGSGWHYRLGQEPFDDVQEAKANACLIAAAPDLLAACEEIVLHWYGLDNNDEKADESHCLAYCQGLIQQAIDKATAKS